MIRLAVEQDIPRLLAMGRKFHDVSPYAEMKFDDDAVSELFRRMMASENAIILCHDFGFIGGVLTPFYFSPTTVAASELFWWAERDGMTLLSHFEAWAEVMGAACVTMSTLDGSDRLGRVMARRGYRAVERSFLRMI